MTQVIAVDRLVKRFRTNTKEAGLAASFKSLIAPTYREIIAVDRVSFKVDEGDLLGLIGPNGAGKSTIIKILTGILYPTSGTIDVLGYNPQAQRTRLAYKIGTVFGQRPQMWYHLPAIDTFNLFSKIYDQDETEYKKRLKQLVDLFQIRPLLTTPVRKLSLGQRMQCEIVAALLHRPRLLFLDEPTIGLDIIAKKRLRQHIQKLNQDEKLTVILTSHDMDDIERICNRVIVINKGKIAYEGTMKSLRQGYLKTKSITVLFEEEVPKLALSHVRIVSQSRFSVTLEVDTSRHPIKKLLDTLVRDYPIKDITIADPPIEEIIETIYRK